MIKVLDPGFYTSIQDAGRFGCQNYGVPVSGSMDQGSANIANRILGNPNSKALLELTMIGCVLKFECNTHISITGSDMDPKLNNLSIEMYSSLEVKKGDVLSFGRVIDGFRTYLAFKGGIDSEKVMNSRSMYNGLTNQFKLNKNDEVHLNDFSKELTGKHEGSIKKMVMSKILECYKGPEFNMLSKQNKELLIEKEYSISNNHNRMGYVLNQKIDNNLKSIITSHVLPGTVQLTLGGRLIILMKDAQTTGGYPRVLQLTAKSIDILSQKKTSSIIKFQLIN